jgi:hypothetical protein
VSLVPGLLQHEYFLPKSIVRSLVNAILCLLFVVLATFGLARAHVPTACVRNPRLCYSSTSLFVNHTQPTSTAQFREAKKSGVILFAPIGDGKWIISEVTYRKPGTRAPIHIHPFGGETCIVYGQMTLWLENVARTATTTFPRKAGECYWMPPNARMSGSNEGTHAAVMIDTFIVEGSEADPSKPDFPVLLVEDGFIPAVPVLNTTTVPLDLQVLVDAAKNDVTSTPEFLDVCM